MPQDQSERNAHRRALAYWARRREERSVFLTSLISDEQVVAVNGSTFVSDRRVVGTVWLERRWWERSVAFADAADWRRGTEHDGRPFVVLTHAPIVRCEWVPGHRILWFQWGRGVRTVPSTSSEFSFGRRRDPVFAALVGALTDRAIPEGTPIERRPEGTRAQRTRASHVTPFLVRRVR